MITQYYTFFGLPDNHNINVTSMVFKKVNDMRELVGFVVESRANSADVALWKPKDFQSFNVINISDHVSDINISSLLIDLLLLFPECVPQWNNIANSVHNWNGKGGMIKVGAIAPEEHTVNIGDDYFVYTSEQVLST